MKVRNTRKYDRIRFKGIPIEPGETKDVDAKVSELIPGLKKISEKKKTKKEE